MKHPQKMIDPHTRLPHAWRSSGMSLITQIPYHSAHPHNPLVLKTVSVGAVWNPATEVPELECPSSCIQFRKILLFANILYIITSDLSTIY